MLIQAMQPAVAKNGIIATPGWFHNDDRIAMIMKQEVLRYGTRR